jgi:uncharacterized protein
MTAALAGLVLGLAGSAHCAAMCGPLAIALRGRAVAGSRGSVDGAARFALYHGARLAAYGSAGFVAGVAGHALSLLGLGRVVAAVAGLALILGAAATLGLIGRRGASGRLSQGLVRVSSTMRRATDGHALLGAIGAGVLNACLPCGMLYGALTAAAALGGSAEAALFMILFGIGTLPGIAACWAMADALAPLLRQRLRLALPWTLAAVGVLLIARGLAAPPVHGSDGRHAGPHGRAPANHAHPAR